MENAVPSVSKLILPIAQIVEKVGGIATNEQIIKGLLELGLERGLLHNGGPRTELEYRAAWARSYLKIYGGLENPKRGVWAITQKGRDIKETQIPQIVNSVVNESRKNRQKQKRSKVSSSRMKSTRSMESLRAESEVSAIDQARTIISLLEKGILSKVAANTALKRLGGV
jgi:restriction system protein